MLSSFLRCRNYLEKRQIHDLELRVAEKSKLQHPGIIIVFGPGDLNVQNSSTATNSVNVLEAPPSYEHATQQGNGTAQTATASSPQRTVLQAEDGLL
ncbi:hypothetical protein ANCCAN_09804 [Ancylostoma caninum]|uniref:Uncharacterized protein n=1 Tax=Ancylostoma caninum TaxID=29170 RepID=A0A368GIK8_ANCCA|nr:hypothetical protein ANCCAN_09804 [Ancylostoma caninum]